MTSQSPLLRSGLPEIALKTDFRAHFGGYFVDKELLITPQIMVAANFRLQHRDQRVILH